eukprot:scaffold461369_cov22-Prasinocladus_malaysianus.AAC.1
MHLPVLLGAFIPRKSQSILGKMSQSALAAKKICPDEHKKTLPGGASDGLISLRSTLKINVVCHRDLLTTSRRPRRINCLDARFIATW